MAEVDAPSWRAGKRRTVVEYLGFAILVFVPLLVVRPGLVTEDTKTYLYLDPGRYLRQAVSLWNPNVALGTVTHENLGYLLPMGPFYWMLAELHVPVWAAQRLWLGALLFAASTGVLYLTRVIGFGGPGRYVAALAFTFTPYILQYTGRISVILMPWSALPWMIAFVVLALRRGGWKYPALFALVVALVSGINASAILYVGIAPVLWFPYSVLVLRDSTWPKVWGVVWRIGLLTSLVSIWWVIGLQVEAAYGVNILKYTETLSATSSASSPFEIIRGLGYWFFYGASEQTGPWTQASVDYTQNLFILGVSFLVPTLALLSSAFVRWRLRAYFILLVVVGMILAVGPYPFDRPTGFGGLLKAFMADTTAGLALRSTDRASPLVLLGLAVLLGAGVTAVATRSSKRGRVVGAIAGVVVIAASAPLWTGDFIVNGLTQPSSPPAYVQAAAGHLNGTHPGTRVYALPGNNFANYRWGDTNDTVWPALLTRPFATHEQQTMGSLATADLLEAMDTPLQEGTLQNQTIAPMASLISAGDVLVQYDQAYERYDTVNPKQVAHDLAVTPQGLSDPVSFGTPRPNISTIPDLNEALLALPSSQKLPAPLVTYSVGHPRPIVRAESLKAPVLLDGNAAGIVDASAFGLLAGNPLIFYAGTLDGSAAIQRQIVHAPASLVVTDTNAKQGYRWNGITENAGYVETATEQAGTTDPSSSPLNLFPTAPADAQSTTAFNGIASVTASSYGSPVKFTVDHRPAAALDGNLSTAWATSHYPVGQWWQVAFTAPRTIDHLNLALLQGSHPGPRVTQVALEFDQHPLVRYRLGPSASTPAGQTLTFPARTFRTLRIRMSDSVQTSYRIKAGSQYLSGFAEVRIPGVTAEETVSMPQDLLRSVGSASIADPLTVIMSRNRRSGFPPNLDPELLLSRSFWLPTARTFALTGQARISALASGPLIAQVTGTAPTITPSSSSRMTGDIAAGALAAIDGNPSTAWEPGLGANSGPGQWIQYVSSNPITVHSFDLQVLADGRHSVPTAITVTVDGTSEHVALPPIVDRAGTGSVVDVPVTLPTSLTGHTVRLTVDSVRAERTISYDTQSPVALPVGIAELGISGLEAPFVPATLPYSCRNDLLTVDGRPVSISVTGATSAGLDRQPLTVTPCGPDAGGIALGAGTHLLRSTPGQSTGIDLDQLALGSAPGGGVTSVTVGGQLPPPVAGATTVMVQPTKATDTALLFAVSGIRADTPPFALVLGQSINAGWQASIGGRSLGPAILADGFANAWRVTPALIANSLSKQGTTTIELRWTPQRRVNYAIVVSALAIVACIVLAIVPVRRRRRHRHNDAGDSVESEESTDPTIERSGPQLASVVDVGRSAAPMRVAITVGVLTGAVVFLIVAPLTGAVVGVATGFVMRNPKARRMLGVVAAGCVLVAGGYITIRQGVRPTLPNGGWPTGYAIATTLVWGGVMLIGADAVVEIVLRYLDDKVQVSTRAADPSTDAGN